MRMIALLFCVVVLFPTGCTKRKELKLYEDLYDGSLPYVFVETKENFIPPPPPEERVWRFNASPGFDIGVDGKLTNYVNDALKQLGLPPVQSAPEALGGHSEGLGDFNFKWSNFRWTDYYGSNLTIRTGGWAIHRDTNRVVFVFLSPQGVAR